MAARIILALALVGCVTAYAQSPPGFTWTQHPTLTWNDFKGRPPNATSYPSAVSNTGFKYQLVCRNGLLDIDVAAFFSPSGSWVRPDGKTPELLRHEQGHFDMAEVYALRLRRAVQHAKIGCEDTAKANAAGEKIVGEFQREWQNAEREYEEDTKYGTDLEKQDAASQKLAADLAALSAYKH